MVVLGAIGQSGLCKTLEQLCCNRLRRAAPGSLSVLAWMYLGTWVLCSVKPRWAGRGPRGPTSLGKWATYPELLL